MYDCTKLNRTTDTYSFVLSVQRQLKTARSWSQRGLRRVPASRWVFLPGSKEDRRQIRKMPNCFINLHVIQIQKQVGHFSSLVAWTGHARVCVLIYYDDARMLPLDPLNLRNCCAWQRQTSVWVMARGTFEHGIIRFRRVLRETCNINVWGNQLDTSSLLSERQSWHQPFQ